MINRVSSRVGLTRLTFSPYNHQQLQEIVAARSAAFTLHSAVDILKQIRVILRPSRTFTSNNSYQDIWCGIELRQISLVASAPGRYLETFVF